MASQAPHDCPGVESQSAGQVSACQGCPNQGICSSGQARQTGPDPDIAEILRRLEYVKHIILVLSGKGGVGKTTVSTTIARCLATDEATQVGLLDIDICGPSVPKAMGIEEEQVHRSASGWSPVWVQDNLAVMSGGLLLESLDDAVIWRGPKKNGLIKQFLRDVDWGELDYLIIDSPPGTSDEHLTIQALLKDCSHFDGALIVTTPQEVSLIDVRKEIDFCRKTNIKMLGIIENMSVFICPHCNKESEIFPATTGGADKLAADNGLQVLAKIPIDPLIGKTCDAGDSLFGLPHESLPAKAFKELISKLKTIVEPAKDV